MRKDWQGLVKILEIQHLRNGKIIWEDKNIYNTFHIGGEMYMLACCFDNPGNFPPPFYYFGLDSRETISSSDLITDISGEPSGNGYLRSSISSSDQFIIDVVEGVYRATSQIITFNSTGSGWGPVNNIFLATTIDNSGVLISSNALSSPLTLENTDSISMRVGLSLRDVS